MAQISRFALAALAMGVVYTGHVALSTALPEPESTIDTLGFESLDHWTLIEGTGPLSLDVDSTAGDYAVRVEGSGWRRIQSRLLSDLNPTGNLLYLDVKLSQGASEWEALTVVITAPSAELWWSELEPVHLGALVPGRWTTVAFMLTEDVRTKVSQASDATLRLAVNSSGPVSLDNLRLAPSSEDYDDAPQGHASFVLPGPASDVCSANPLTLVDIQADFRDIWRGFESPDTGKQQDPRASIGLVFDHPIPSESVNAYIRQLGDAQCDDEIVRVMIPPSSATWLHWTPELPGAQYPGGFNAFVHESIIGLHDSHGPIAAGSFLQLQDFSVNTVVGSPHGVVSGGTATLSSGTIFGNFHAPHAGPVPETVTIQSGTQSSTAAIDFGSVFKTLQALSGALASVTLHQGVVEAQDATLTLRGHDPDTNVFFVPGELLGVSHAIHIDVPPAAAAIVNVAGIDVQMSSAGIVLNGTDPARVLWNFPHAKTLLLSNIGVRGSVLAPVAVVSFPNGNLDGTLVARSLHGPGELHYFPLNAEAVLGPMTTTRVVLKPQRPLRPNCNYEFYLAAAGTAAACLPEPVNVSFAAAPFETAPRDRELDALRVDPSTGLLLEFRARPGVNTPVDDVWERYDAVTGDDLVQEQDMPATVDSTRRRLFFRQYIQGYPVRGAGYFVEAEDGMFRAAAGKVVEPLPLLEPQITSEMAVENAISGLSLGSLPWESEPAKYTAPTAEAKVSLTTFPGSPTLIYEIDFRHSGLMTVTSVDVDARSGDVLYVESSIRRQLPFSHQPPSGTYRGQRAGVLETQIPWHGDVTIGTAAYEDGGTTTHYLSSDEYDAPGSVSVDRDDGTIQSDISGSNVWDSTTEAYTVGTLYWGLVETISWLDGGGPNYLFQGTPWLGVAGLGAGRSRVRLGYFAVNDAQAYFPDFVPGEYGALWFSSWGWDPKDASSRIPVYFQGGTTPGWSPLPPETAAHELGHALFAALRDRSGLPDMQYRKESGALTESIADIFASSLKLQRVSFASDPEWYRIGLEYGHSRNLWVPTDTDHPAWYRGVYYEDYSGQPDTSCHMDNDYCAVHINSTVISRWATLLTQGELPGTTTLCGLRAEPLASDVVDAQQRVGQIIVDALQWVDSDATFRDFRDRTYAEAEKRYSADVATLVAGAWYAVGLGSAERPKPADGAQNVEPWDTTLEWKALASGEWTVQISTGPTFEPSATTEHTVVASGSAGDATASLTLTLKPATRYYWRVAPGTGLNAGTWSSCTLGTWSFSTRGKTIVITEPSLAGGVYQTDYIGRLAWNPVPGVSEYRIKISGSQLTNGCDASGVTRVGIWPYDSAVQYDVFASSDFGRGIIGPNSTDEGYSIYGPGNTIDATVIPQGGLGVNEYLYFQARRGDTRGTCHEFRLRKRELGKFARLAPASELHDHDGRVPEIVDLHSTGLPRGGFTFTKSDKAVSYNLQILRLADVDHWYGQHTDIVDYDETRFVDHCALKDLGSGVLKWTFEPCGGNAEPDFVAWSATGGLALWRVTALSSDGMRREAAVDAGSLFHSPILQYQMDHLPWDTANRKYGWAQALGASDVVGGTCCSAFQLDTGDKLLDIVPYSGTVNQAICGVHKVRLRKPPYADDFYMLIDQQLKTGDVYSSRELFSGTEGFTSKWRTFEIDTCTGDADTTVSTTRVILLPSGFGKFSDKATMLMLSYGTGDSEPEPNDEEECWEEMPIAPRPANLASARQVIESVQHWRGAFQLAGQTVEHPDTYVTNLTQFIADPADPSPPAGSIPLQTGALGAGYYGFHHGHVGAEIWIHGMGGQTYTHIDSGGARAGFLIPASDVPLGVPDGSGNYFNVVAIVPFDACGNRARVTEDSIGLVAFRP